MTDPDENINPLWRIADPLTVQQAAALIAGYDPNWVRFGPSGSWLEDRHGLTDLDETGSIDVAMVALTNAINARKLKATIRRTAWERGWDEEPSNGERFESKVRLHETDVMEAWMDDLDPEYVTRRGVIYRVSPDWSLTTVARADLIEWLEGHGFRPSFFFPTATNDPDYLDPKNPRYAPKLAAAVRAWQAVTNTGGKSPRQALEKWIREHAAQFGLTNDDGMPTKTAVEEIAKVANWNDKGGAPKTPSN